MGSEQEQVVYLLHLLVLCRCPLPSSVLSKKVSLSVSRIVVDNVTKQKMVVGDREQPFLSVKDSKQLSKRLLLLLLLLLFLVLLLSFSLLFGGVVIWWVVMYVVDM